MEKITKTPLADLPSLSVLADNYVQWGEEFKRHLDSGGKSSDFAWENGTYTIRRREALRTHLDSGGGNSDFEWKVTLYFEMRHQLCLITKEHCSFCDGHPVADKSKEGIEHYFSKNKYPLRAYDWTNLFYCCDKCQSESTKAFQETLKPDDSTYQFDNYFYFDLGSGEVKVFENLEVDNLEAFAKATAFIIRYGINSPTRTNARKNLYQDMRNYFVVKTITNDVRERDDFPYRYVYDHYVKVNSTR